MVLSLATKFSRVPVAVRRFSMATAGSSSPGPIESAIRRKLTAQLPAPTEIDISNDSFKHRHHAAMLESGGGPETHFSVQVVSAGFEGKTTMQRHRLVFNILSEEMEQGLHSLTLKTKTFDELARTRAS